MAGIWNIIIPVIWHGSSKGITHSNETREEGWYAEQKKASQLEFSQLTKVLFVGRFVEVRWYFRPVRCAFVTGPT